MSAEQLGLQFEAGEDEGEGLPPGWTRSNLIDIVASHPNAMTDGPFGSKLKSSHYVDEGVRVIRLGNVGVGEFRDDDESYISPTHAATLSRHAVEAGDLIIAALAEPVGRSCQVPASILPAVVKADCVRFQPHADIVPRFLMHWLNSPGARKNAEAHSHGLGRLRINMRGMRQLEVLLAPLPEQKRIVAEIEKQFTRLDDAVATLERVKTKLDRARASVLKAAVEGRLVPTEASLAAAAGRAYEPAAALLECVLVEREEAHAAAQAGAKRKKKYKPPAAPETEGLPELPEGWTWATAEQLTHPSRLIRYGILKPGPDLSPDGRPYVKVKHMRGDVIVPLDKLPRTSQAIFDRYAAAALARGDLLVSIRGTYGRVALVPDELHGANITQDSARVAPMKGIDRGYMRHALLSPFVQHYFSRVARGVAVKGVNIRDLRPTPLPLPPLAEQKRIVAEVERRLSVIDAAASAADANLKRCAHLRQSILKRAFEGRLVPQDPRDEPASVLLERIRAARTEAAAK